MPFKLNQECRHRIPKQKHKVMELGGLDASLRQRSSLTIWFIVSPRSTAVPSEMAETAPTQRDHPLQTIAEHGRVAWQKASGYKKRARAEAAIGKFKQVTGYSQAPTSVGQRRWTLPSMS